MNNSIASVIRHPSGQDFTNNGISSRFDRIIIDDEMAPYWEEDCYNSDGALVAPYAHRVGDHYEPVCEPKDGFEGWMYGGNDIVVDGVRYRLHDRQESRSEYLSYK